jgi:hemerythrin superfamily protein
MDAIAMLKADHKTVEGLFARFEKAGDRAHVKKREIVDRIIEELSVHAAVEEQLLYPVVRATIPDEADAALESLEEHHVVKWLLWELESMEATDERFDAKVAVLMDMVRHHVEEEESDLFPKVRDELGRKILNELGEAMTSARQLAPTKPHPQASDTPPRNLVTGTAAGVADRIGDTVSGIAQGGVTAAGDIIDRVMRREKRRPTPTGSSIERATANKVRSGAADATQAVIDATAATVRKGQEAVADAAEESANRTRKAARKSSAKARSGTGRSGTKKAKSATRRPAKKATAKKTTKRPARKQASRSS